MLERYGHGGDVWTAAETYGRPKEQFLDFSSNMNPLGPPEAIGRIMREQWRDVAQYPDPAVRELTRKLAEKHGIHPDCILAGNGAAELIDLAVRVLRPKVTGLARPSFSEYEEAVEKSDGRLREIPLRPENGFELRDAELEEAAACCDLLFLGHPNNPTGKLLPESVVRRLAAGDIPAIVDEAFLDFSAKEESLTLIPAAAKSGKLIVIRSMTKFYAIPGIRLGYAVAHPDLIQAMRRLQVQWSVNALAQWIGAAVLEERAFAAQTLRWLPEENVRLTGQLRALGLEVYDSDVNFILLSLKPFGLKARELQAEMGRRGILIRDASLFKGLDESHVRVAVKLREQNEALVAGLKASIEALVGSHLPPELAGSNRHPEREARGDVPSELALKQEPTGQDSSKQRAQKQEESMQDTSMQDTPMQNAPKQDVPLQAAPQQDKPLQNAPKPAGRLAPTLMLQGTASDVGKSLLTAAICRILLQDGRRVAPFKSQNMSLNSYVTPDGKEIGRAQGMQADACRIQATTDMNPILLKPKKDMVSQVVVHGKPYRDLDARAYRERYLPEAESVVKEALERLRRTYDVVVIEGAGSPAEVNLKDRDIVNMRLAGWADAPVLLVADIDRGGVFASLVGTLDLLTPEERARVKGFIINKFRGDVSLLKPGIDWLEQRTGKPVLGVIPYLPQLGLEDEDSASLDRRLAENAKATGVPEPPDGMLDIAVIRLPRISNFTDIDPLAFEPDVRLRFVTAAEEFGRPDAVIVPGSKNTVDDLLYLRHAGLDRILAQYAAGNGFVAAICAGYQMLGEKLLDPLLVESDRPELEGIGLFPAQTVFAREKRTVRTNGTTRLYGEQTLPIQGYEIHMGQTEFRRPVRHPFEIIREDGSAAVDGAATEDGRVWGTYLHGILHNDDFRRAWLNRIRHSKGLEPLPAELRFLERREAAFDRLAAHVRNHLDLDRLYAMIGK